MSSFIIRDTLGPSVAKSNQRLATWRRFKKAWPHDKSRYDRRLVYYDGNLLDTVEFRRFCNIIGLKYSDLENQDYDEIEECWFFLKQPTVDGASFSAQEMFDAMGSDAIEHNDVVNIKFTYGGKLGRILPGDTYVAVNSTDYGTQVIYDEIKAMEAIAIQAKIMTEPDYYVLSQMPRAVSSTRDNYMYSEGDEYSRYEPRSPMTSELLKRSNSTLYEKPMVQITSDMKYGWYALFDDNNLTFVQESITQPVALGVGEGYGYEWTVTYRASKDIAPADGCMIKYEAEFNKRIHQQKMNGSLPHRTTEVDFRHIYEVDDIDLWPGGQLSVPASDAMKKKDLMTMLSSSIDSDYEIEDPSFWEKVFAIVVIIVAVVVTIFSLGTMSWATIPAAAAAIGWAFAMGALVLAIGSAILGYFGGPSANGLVKIIGNCAQYMGLVASVLGIMSFIGNFVQKMSSEAIMAAGKKAAEEASKKAATKAAGKVAYEQAISKAVELASSSFVERALSVATDAISGALSAAGDSVVSAAQSVSSWADNLFSMYKYYDQNFGEVAELNTDIADKQEELDKLNEENASSKLLISGMDVYTYSLGSFDAIAELNVKMDKQFGGWTTDQDPCASIT